MMWSVTHCDDILDKMKGLQEPTVYYLDLQTSSGRSSVCNQAQQEKVLFRRLKFINMTPLNNDSRKVQ